MVKQTVRRFQLGFTLVELLVVMAIIGILSGVIGSNFVSSRSKARDAKRKSDLQNIQRSLEMYLNDKGHYPRSESGYIYGCGIEEGSKEAGAACSWGSPFVDSSVGTIYMAKLPTDPSSDRYYFYMVNTEHTKYKIYAALEDPDTLGYISPYPVVDAGTTAIKCGASAMPCTYAVSSSNTIPDSKEW